MSFGGGIRRQAAFWATASVVMALVADSGHCGSRKSDPDIPRNIILFIGDGMGVAHITAARIAAGGLNMERFGVAGLLATWSADELVTDSAAAATAFATGTKTRNGSVSVDSSGNILPTVFERAEKNGFRTGIVVTCSVTHATPAAFVSHAADRHQDCEIARQIASSGIDLLFGGGLSYFLPSTVPGGGRPDTCDLVAAMRRRMTVVTSIDELRNFGGKGPIAAFLAANHPGPAGERAYTLAELTEKAISMLSEGPGGFFLMVEGSQIDWEAHENDAPGVVLETIDFDRAIGAGLDFARRDGRTLVLATADHETGGFAVLGGSLPRAEISSFDFATGEHTASMVVLLASGPGDRHFGGMHDNTWLGRMMIGLVEKER